MFSRNSSRRISEKNSQSPKSQNSQNNQPVTEIQFQNSPDRESLPISCSKNILDFRLEGEPCPIAKSPNDPGKIVLDVVTLTNNQDKSYDFEILPFTTSPKYSLTVDPAYGKIKKHSTINISFRMSVFCTTKISDQIWIEVKPHQKDSIFRKSKEFSSHFLTLQFKVESQLSPYLDFDEIEVKEKIASGGYGKVYRGIWRSLEVAVKKFHEQHLSDSLRDILQREIKLMRKLNCPYIVTYIGSTQLPGQTFCFVMEFCREGSLGDLLQREELTLKFKIKILLDIARGMCYLHCNNIFHRDLKPDNILVVSKNENFSGSNVKITDFDTARSFLKRNQLAKSDSDSAVDQARLLSKNLGTLIYKAPDIMEGSTDYAVDKCDVYSFAIIMWQVLTQRIPYSSEPFDRMTNLEIERFVKSGQRLELPRDHGEDRLNNLIQGCWDPDANRRPSFEEIVKVLEETYADYHTSPLLHAPEKLAARKSRSMIHISRKDNSLSPSQNRRSFSSSQIEIEGWIGSMGRTEAEEKLKMANLEGAYLIRWSSHMRAYVLSYLKGNSCYHVLITLSSDGVTIEMSEGHLEHFSSLVSFINKILKLGIISVPLKN